MFDGLLSKQDYEISMTRDKDVTIVNPLSFSYGLIIVPWTITPSSLFTNKNIFQVSRVVFIGVLYGLIY